MEVFSLPSDCGRFQQGRNRVARVSSRAILLLVAVFFALPLAHGSEGETWLLQTRQLGCVDPSSVSPERFDIRLLHGGTWERADIGAMIEGYDPSIPTVVYCHGNLSDLNLAVLDGQAVRRAIACGSGQPFRMVIWAWSADRSHHSLLVDSRVKAHRADVESIYLARFLQTLPPEARVTLVGYSFGARIVAGALHLLSGGPMAGHLLTLEADDSFAPPPPRCRLVLIAPAFDQGDLLRGRKLGGALEMSEASLVSCNPRDRALKYYPLLRGRGGPEAAGRGGPYLAADQRAAVELVNVSPMVGRSHDLHSYLRSTDWARRMARYVFSCDEAASD